MPAFHAFYDGQVIDSVTANTIVAARRYFKARYGAVEVKPDPTAAEGAAIKQTQAAKDLTMVVGAHVVSSSGKKGIIASTFATPKTGVFAAVDFDDGTRYNCSTYYLEVQ